MTTIRATSPTQVLRAAVNQFRAVLPVAPAPRYVEPEPDGRTEWLRRLDRVRATLEQARDDLTARGWTSGAWFSVATASGMRPATTSEAYDLLHAASTTNGGCLVGTMLKRAHDPDRATTVPDVWGALDELVEAMHEAMGHDVFPPGRCYALPERYGRLQTLTAWNDAPGRTQDQVLALVDRAVSRTLVGACVR